ncbi:DUF276 domain-containing protein [Borrelia duttonii]|uniref:Uncharacterized conserved protein n=1 Tax=Borrelia duttonii (strain Ly) TaxID=412419 RepID=B5RNU2_BORDL|nr:uncharacterized conserved protein [Borrelia duttonii Ly]
MSILFDSDVGVLKKNIEQIVNAKRQYLRDNYKILINDDPASIYNIIATSLAFIECELIDEVNKLFQSIKPDSEYWQAIEKHISVKSTTYEAIKNSLLSINGITHANIKSTAGTASIYVIVDEEFMNSDKTQIEDTNLKANIWNILYLTCPIGTTFEGDIIIDGINNNNQRIEYKVSLGKKKYVYLKSKYKVNVKNHLYLNVDAKIRDIYTRIANNNYGDMGISFEYQDFFAPVNEIKGVHCIDVSVALKENLNTKINEINDSEFTNNENIQVEENEILDFDFTSDRLLINISS